MARATQKVTADVPDEAPVEPVAEPGPDTWVRSEHVLQADSLYGQPSWLVEAVLKNVEGESFTQAEVRERIDAFLAHTVDGGS